jgi:hypothetical protein
LLDAACVGDVLVARVGANVRPTIQDDADRTQAVALLLTAPPLTLDPPSASPTAATPSASTSAVEGAPTAPPATAPGRSHHPYTGGMAVDGISMRRQPRRAVHIIPYTGSPDTRLGRERSWPGCSIQSTIWPSAVVIASLAMALPWLL